MAIAFDAAASGHTSATSVTFTHTIGSGSNRIVFVCLAYRYNASILLNVSATFGGAAMTFMDSNVSTWRYGVYAWYLKNPTPGANTVVVTEANGNRYMYVGSVSFSGVDQTTPFGTRAKATGTSTAPAVTVASAVGSVCLDVVYTEISTSAGINADAGQTGRWKEVAAYLQSGAGSTKDGAASVVMSWTLGSSVLWYDMGWSINAAASVGVPKQFMHLARQRSV